MALMTMLKNNTLGRAAILTEPVLRAATQMIYDYPTFFVVGAHRFSLEQ